MKIFLSYRRADSQATAGQIAQFLESISLIDSVFLDVDGIEIGENFEQKIQPTLAKSTHAFLLIGPQWKGAVGTQDRPRIFDPDDVVRQETHMALNSNVKVIPILLDAATMPQPSELPDDLMNLSKINAFSLRNTHFNQDMDEMFDNLVGGKKKRGSRWRQTPLTLAGVTLPAITGFAFGAAILIGLGLVDKFADNGCEDLVCTLRKAFDIVESDALALMWGIIIIVLGLGTFAPFVPRVFNRKR
ncbi:toll/interleukin-1 receptor domain-containing protein [bacterium]|nr:toll/interleukin-1 receptor domain-containing protein [bacterium]